jgi:hypothetical protein
MSATTFNTAMQLVKDAQYLQFKDDYYGDDCRLFLSDAGTTTIRVADASDSKTIKHYSGCEGFPRQEPDCATELSRARDVNCPRLQE